MKIAALILQILCIIAVTFGIIFEVKHGANIAFVLITAGGLAFGLSEKLDKYRIKQYIDRVN
jgi:hypothetical protein